MALATTGDVAQQKRLGSKPVGGAEGPRPEPDIERAPQADDLRRGLAPGSATATRVRMPGIAGE